MKLSREVVSQCAVTIWAIDREEDISWPERCSLNVVPEQSVGVPLVLSCAARLVPLTTIADIVGEGTSALSNHIAEVLPRLMGQT